MIKMIAGVFGLPVNGVVKAMDKNSDAFEASPEQEARLVQMGLAEYVTDGTPIGFDEAPDDLTEDEAPETPLEDMSAKELRALGKEYGLTFKVGMSKAEMVAALDAHIAENIADGVEVDEDEAVYEDAPTFDASEAVQ